LTYNGVLTKPTITRDKYNVVTMTIGELIFALTNHRFSFDDIKAMTIDDLMMNFVKMNAGEIKTWAEWKAEQKKQGAKK
jgi:hypothetical protein